MNTAIILTPAHRHRSIYKAGNNIGADTTNRAINLKDDADSILARRTEDALKAKLAADWLVVEARKLRDELTRAFDCFNRDKINLDQLRRIKAIVDEGKAQ
jgi:hypothetical protein